MNHTNSVSRRLFGFLAALCLGSALSLAWAQSESPTTNESQITKIDDDRLHNAFWVHSKVISGAQPDANGFQALADLGVKTIISVDGAKPDLEAAKKHKLRYVHLPHGYDGITEDRIQELAKAVLKLEGPIYIHCHHGKHRSPTAAAAACVASGLISQQNALPILETAGTSPKYKGLYRTAKTVRMFDRKTLEMLNVEFKPTVQVPPMAQAMIDMAHTFERLGLIAEEDWQTPKEHPDLDPAHEALLMQEHYTELLRSETSQPYPQGFRDLLSNGEAVAKRLHEDLHQSSKESKSQRQLKSFDSALTHLKTNCAECHRQYRDDGMPHTTSQQ